MISQTYAIIQTSGKQFIAKPGNWCDIDLLTENVPGDFLYFSKILFFQKEKKIQIGTPFLKQLQIPAKIIQIVKGDKVLVVKTKPKKNYSRTRGHSQYYTRIQFDTTIN
jgi:large subunit ribosomal protein L21